MITITHYREKCIGCNYCVEVSYGRWRMSKKDGKSVLLGSEEKGGFHRIRVGDDELEESLKAQQVCPVKIIKVQPF